MSNIINITKTCYSNGNMAHKITKEKEIENDRKRIFNKFNFCPNAPSYKTRNNPSLCNALAINHTPTFDHLMFPSKTFSSENASLDNQSCMDLTSKTNNPNIKKYTRNKKVQFQHDPKTLSLYKTESTMAGNTFNNEKSRINETEIVTENRMNIASKLVTSSFADENVKGQEINCIDNLMFATLHENKADNIGNSNNNKLDSNINLLSGNYFFSNPMSSREENSNNISNSNNNQYDSNSQDSSSRYKQQMDHKKVIHLLSSHSKYNMSNRLINDETNTFHVIPPNSEYKFIDKIREDSFNIQRINLKKFLGVSQYPFYLFLSFCYDNYNHMILKTNSIISSKIRTCLYRAYISFINDFSQKYKTVLKCEQFTFEQRNITQNRKNLPILDLIIKAKIISSDINVCCTIGYDFSYLNKRNEDLKLENVWKFDVLRKKDISYWCGNECEIFHENPKRFSYIKPILPFIKGDSIQITINIFSKDMIVNPNTIKWKPLKIERAPDGFYQKALLKSPYPFDNLRACETENMVYYWKDNQEFLEKSRLIKDFIKIFEKKFLMEKILYDTPRILLFKIIMRADKTGVLKRNLFCNFDIEIVDKEKNICNEIHNLFVLNMSISSCKQLQIRKGSLFYFYIREAELSC